MRVRVIDVQVVVVRVTIVQVVVVLVIVVKVVVVEKVVETEVVVNVTDIEVVVGRMGNAPPVQHTHGRSCVHPRENSLSFFDGLLLKNKEPLCFWNQQPRGRSSTACSVAAVRKTSWVAAWRLMAKSHEHSCMVAAGRGQLAPKGWPDVTSFGEQPSPESGAQQRHILSVEHQLALCAPLPIPATALKNRAAVSDTASSPPWALPTCSQHPIGLSSTFCSDGAATALSRFPAHVQVSTSEIGCGQEMEPGMPCVAN